MNDFTSELKQRLDEIRAQGLYRELRRVDSPQSARISLGGRTLLNFSSNDYLGLANHPVLKEAAVRAIERFGTGAGASRLICGSLAPHGELEDALAHFERTEAALSFSSGYATALGTIGALIGKGDAIQNALSDMSVPENTDDLSGWINETEGFLSKELGAAFVARFRDYAGLTPPQVPSNMYTTSTTPARVQHWALVMLRLARLQQFSDELSARVRCELDPIRGTKGR